MRAHDRQAHEALAPVIRDPYFRMRQQRPQSRHGARRRLEVVEVVPAGRRLERLRIQRVRRALLPEAEEPPRPGDDGRVRDLCGDHRWPLGWRAQHASFWLRNTRSSARATARWRGAAASTCAEITLSTRRCPCHCVCSMAWSFQAIDATLSPW